MIKNKHLAVIILTTDNISDNDHLPKVCHKISHKTMLEIAITKALKLDPKRIIIICNRQNIRSINKVLRDKHYTKILSIHIDNKNIGPSVSKRCYEEYNVLVMPGYSPLIKVTTLKKMISSDYPLVKLTDNLFFIKNTHLKYINNLDLIDFEGTFKISPEEIKEVNTKEDFEKIKKIFKLRKYKGKNNSIFKKNNSI